MGIEDGEGAAKEEILPWLIYSHGGDKSKQVQTFSTGPFNNKSYLKSIPVLRGKRIELAYLGWLVLLDLLPEYPNDTYSITLWNPFTFESINLPPFVYPGTYLGHGFGRIWCAFTSPPNSNTDDSCFVFLFFPGLVYSYPYRPTCKTDMKWVSRRIEFERQRTSIYNLVTLRGVIYGMANIPLNNYYDHFSRREIIVRIEVADNGSNSFTITFLPLITVPEGNLQDVPLLVQCYKFLVESCGTIYLVRVGTCHYNGVHDVRIYELYLDKGIWTEVKCLGDRALLLSIHSSTWCWASTGGEGRGGVHGNSVYFWVSAQVKEGVVWYQLNDCTSTFLPCPRLLNPHYHPVWVTPPHQRLSGRWGCEAKIEETNDGSKLINGCILEARDETIQQNYLCELPLHIIELISKNMHLFDYWNFRSTSKVFHSATSAPRWRTNNVFPLFMNFENSVGLCRVMDPFRQDSHSCILKFSKEFFNIHFSNNGWLLIFDAHSDSLFFFNPFTREKRYIPSIKRRYYRIGFSSSPTCSECMIVSSTRVGIDVVIDLIQPGDINWSVFRFHPYPGIQFTPGRGSPVYYAGAFYILDQRVGSLGVFQLVDGTAQWTAYDGPFGDRDVELHSCHLVECGGELLSVIIGMNGKWIRVFKWHNLKNIWVRFKDLGNHILFISHVSCFSEVTRDREMRNRVYLPWLIGKRNVFYSLDTEKYHTWDNEHSYKDFFSMKQPLRCCWI